ncbi:DUF2271 domain-containing protein [Saccharicrinis sp. FJH54]|uniref:DUF2271 domain-containing protein n=1 Tax=Saccharicrinis sp. FJH54 TaxID=3344665 RepID=UPI0035D3F984
MKFKATILSLLFLLPFMAKAQNNARIDFTVNVSGIQGPYSPKHVMAIWIVDNEGNFVNSLAVYGNERLGNLWAWWAASKGLKADAVTAATQVEFKSYNVTWNLKDYNGNTVPDGTYTMWVEATSDDWEGPNYSFDFTVGGEDYTLKPDGTKYFSQLVLDYIANDNTPVNRILDQPEIAVFPNPVQHEFRIELNLPLPAFTDINIVDLGGRNVENLYSGMILAGKNSLNIKRDPRLKAGDYFISVRTDNFLWTKKLVLE